MVYFSPYGDRERANDLVKYGKNEFPDSLRQNIFFDDLNGFTTIALPKGTKVYYTTDKEYPSREYRLYKPLSFDIRIEIRFSSGFIGLGSVGHYVGLTNIEDRFTRTEDPNVKNYETVILKINCEAKFNPIRAWHPSVVRYKEWAQNLFDDLYNTFDWSICQTGIRNYQQALSSQKIINKLK